MLILAAVLQGERTRRSDLGWTLLAFVGVACSTDPARLWHRADRGYPFGIALTLLAAPLLMSRRISRERPLAVVPVQWLGLAMIVLGALAVNLKWR